MQPYINKGPVDCEQPFDLRQVEGKTALVTGGANGIGEAYVRELVRAGAFVLIVDLAEQDGQALQAHFGSQAKFVRCDVAKWDQQLRAFQAAVALSPSKRIDIVVANAGISENDSIFAINTEDEVPKEPDLSVVNVNLCGALYTVQLALHYFRRQYIQAGDTPSEYVLILQGSLAGYVDLPGGLQYAASKYALRGVMKSLRRSEWKYNIRVASIAPWYIKTKILAERAFKVLDSKGIEYAEAEDAAAALMRILTDANTNGRSFAIVPRSIAPSGHIDIDTDDYKEGTLLDKLQTESGGSSSTSLVGHEKLASPNS